MCLLSTDAILHIGSFLNPKDVVSLTRVNRDIRENSDQLLRVQYQKAFGNINVEQRPNKETLIRLLCFADKQLNAEKNYNVYKVPSHFLERLKWMAGVENKLDVEVQKNYEDSINLLEKTKPVSIIQLKNKLLGFWFMNSQVKDYLKYKSEEMERATSSLLTTSFFACTKLFYKYYYNPSIINIGKNLESRSKKNFAKIGSFHLNGKDYDVVAFHILAKKDAFGSRFPSKFKSVIGTNISILEKNNSEQFHFFKRRSICNFFIRIGRRKVAGGYPLLSFEEKDCIYQKEATVFNSKRFLVIDNGLSYENYTKNVRGSDRLLDQKLTQIMIEMTMQNQRIKSLKLISENDSLLTAAGFKSKDFQNILQALHKFRLDEENNLFPPYRMSGTCNLIFKPEEFTKQIVYFSKGSPESWEEIIQREPILTEKSGILPEYWIVKPNIIDKNIA